MPYFLVSGALRVGERFLLDTQEAHHALRAQRIRAGERFRVQDSRGRHFLAVLSSSPAARAEGETLRELPPSAAPTRQVILVQAALKEKATSWLLQKACELGVAEIKFFQAARSQGRGKPDPGIPQRWERILEQARKQCGRSKGPLLTRSPSLSACLECLPKALASQANAWILSEAAPLEETFEISPSVANPSAVSSRVSSHVQFPPLHALYLLVGPEGGLSADEEALAYAAGFRPLRLGGYTLRAETAAIAGSALLLFGGETESRTAQEPL